MMLFDICFDDFRKYFPKVFESIGYDLSGERNPNLKPRPSELYITPEFEQAVKRETGKTIDDLLDEETKKGNFNDLRIIRREKD